MLNRPMAGPSPRVIQRVREDFAAEVADAVIAQLAAIPESIPLGVDQDAERLQAGLVLAASGDPAAFRSLLELARTDWRDVLTAAGLAGADWPTRLIEALGPAHPSRHLSPYPLRPQPWEQIVAEYTELAIREPLLDYLLAISNSIVSSPARARLSGRVASHVKDLEVAANPLTDQPAETIVVRTPLSLRTRAPKGKVVIEHLSSTGRNDTIERPVEDAVPLFWRFCIEKFDVHPE